MRDLLDPAEREPTVGVSELIERLRGSLAEEFGTVWVEGEISSLFRSGAGHLYLDLKDERAQLRCVVFASSARRLEFEPGEGLLVRARGRLDVYPERGSLQLIVDELVPAGEGALRLAFERLKQRLFEEGLFAPEHKRELPYLPDCVGLVTSMRGAAIHDFVRALRRRRAALELLVYDARVQGAEAWRELVRGLHLLDQHPRVSLIVLARGGGSLEDLWSFNREELVRAIFELETPVVSAIGHEIDLVLTDLVADARAPTPTAAADLVAPDGDELMARVRVQGARLAVAQRALLARERQRLAGLHRALVHPAQRIASLARRLAAARGRLLGAAQRAQEARSARLGGVHDALGRALGWGRERRGVRLATLGARLDALSPLAVLQRGYAIARRTADGVILRSSREAPPGTELDLRLAEGGLRATVRAEDA